MEKREKLEKTIRQYGFLFFAIIAMLLPDLLLRELNLFDMIDEWFVRPVTWMFTGGWVGFVLFFCVAILPRRAGKITFFLVTVLFLLLAFSQYIYFKIFEQFFWLKNVVLVGEGADYFGYAIRLIDGKLIVFTILTIAFMILALWKWKKPELSKKKYFWILCPVLILLLTHLYMQPELHRDSSTTWDSWKKPRVVYQKFNDVNKSFSVTGLYQFAFRNLSKEVFERDPYGEEGIARIDEYFAAKGEPEKNRYTGMFKGKNVIAVMMESIDTWMLSEKYTPNLCKMMRNGIHFANYNAPFFGVGFTFSSEFAFHTGFFTPPAASSASNFSNNKFPYSMVKLFTDAGYTANSFHFNNSEFYNRGIMHKNFGYEKYHSFMEFGLSEWDAQLDSNAIEEDAIYQKMIEKQPFFDFIITYSAHLPYNKEEDAKLVKAKEKFPHLIDESMEAEKNNALILAADTDAFFGRLLKRLEEDDLLKDTVIVAYTDHYSYGISDSELLKKCKGDDLTYHVPAFIYSPGVRRQKVNKPMMTIDWLPTMVNLFDLNREGRYIGNDIFDPENKGFAYFETSAWMDENQFYEPGKEEELETEEMIDIIKNNQRVRESMEINDMVVLGDYYKK